MDRERLNELLHDPSGASAKDLAALRAMAERYPWFSGAQLLVAVAGHEAGDVLANGNDGRTAAFLPSRAVLYDLVHREEPVPNHPSFTVRLPLPTTPAIAVDTLASGPGLVQLGPSDQPGAGPSIPSGTAQPADTSAAAEEPPPQDPAATILLPEPPTTGAELTANRVPPAGLTSSPVRVENAPAKAERNSPDVLDLQIQEAIHASGYDLGQANRVPPAAPTPMEMPEVKDTATDLRPAAPVPPDHGQPGIGEEALPPPLAEDARMSFLRWLEQDPEPAPTLPHPEFTAKAPLGPDSPPLPGAPPEKKPLGANELMERFIRNTAPPDPKPKARFYTPQQAAKKSLEDTGMVSETLARIMEQQGNFAKAKEVYDRLALKHPEKSVYFAALSKALEGRSNK